MVDIEEGAGTVVDGFPAQGHVVGIHHAMDKPHAHPTGYQLGLSFDHCPEQGQRLVFGSEKIRIVPLKRVLGERLESGAIAQGAGILECPDADVTGSHAR